MAALQVEAMEPEKKKKKEAKEAEEAEATNEAGGGNERDGSRSAKAFCPRHRNVAARTLVYVTWRARSAP